MKKAGKGKLKHIHIEPGANGYSVRAHHERPMPSGGDKEAPMMPMEDEQPSFFNNKEDVRDHVHGLMAAHEGGGGEPDADDDHPLRKAIRRR